jgi:hypothetical protein
VLTFQVVLIKTLQELRTAERNRQLRLLNSRRTAVSLSVTFTYWADIAVCLQVLARNERAERFLQANGCDFRFRSFLQAKMSFAHWHSLCASVLLGEKPQATAALRDHQIEELELEHQLQHDITLESRSEPASAASPQRSPGTSRRAAAGVGEVGGKRSKKAKKRKRKSLLRKVAMSKTLESFVSGVIVLNVAVMMLDMDRQSWPGEFWATDNDFRSYLAVLEMANTLFTVIFTAECLLKMVGMGTNAIHGDHLFWPGAPIAYFRNGFNIFDFVVVVLTGIQIPSSIDMIRCYLRRDGSECNAGSAGVSVLRMFRLARLVRLIRNFPRVQEQVVNLIKVARPAAAQSVIMIIFIVILSIMGKDLLGANLLKPPSSADHLAIHSRVFVRSRQLPGGFARLHPAKVLAVEDSSAQLWPVMVEVVKGWSILLQMEPKVRMRARLSADPQWHELAGWSQDPCDVQAEVRGQVEAAVVEEECGGLIVGIVPRTNFETMQDGMLAVFQLFLLEEWHVIALEARTSVGPVGETFIYVILCLGNFLLVNVFVAIVALGFGEAAKAEVKKRAHTSIAVTEQPQARPATAQGEEEENAEAAFDTRGVPLRVCGLLSGGKNDPTFRYYMGLLVTSSLFDRAILGGIVLSSVLLALETYPPVTGQRRQVMADANTALNVLFATELLLKVLWFGPVNYIKNGWNKMDSFIVFTSVCACDPGPALACAHIRDIAGDRVSVSKSECCVVFDVF